MTVLWIILALISFLLFLLFLNVHLIFKYDQHATVTLRILFLRFDAMKLFRSLTEQKKGDEKNEPTAPKDQQNRKADPVGFAKFLSHITRIIALAVKEHFSKMKINLKRLQISIGTDDAAKTALLCGGVIQAANVLCELLRRFSRFRCDNRNLSVSPDFTSEQSRLSIHLDLSSKPIHIIGVLLRSYFRFFEREEVQNARNTTQTGH